MEASAPTVVSGPQVLEVIKEILPHLNVTSDVDLFANYYIDLLALLDIIDLMEKRFEFEITSDALSVSRWQSVDAMAATINALRSSKGK